MKKSLHIMQRLFWSWPRDADAPKGGLHADRSFGIRTLEDTIEIGIVKILSNEFNGKKKEL
ncbi:MAG: hypothetical protein IPP06_09225 [Saprospiraceae bacterium]|nr:hypothetical protein [Candidatus Vicinibacter affinis]